MPGDALRGLPLMQKNPNPFSKRKGSDFLFAGAGEEGRTLTPSELVPKTSASAIPPLPPGLFLVYQSDRKKSIGFLPEKGPGLSKRTSGRSLACSDIFLDVLPAGVGKDLCVLSQEGFAGLLISLQPVHKPGRSYSRRPRGRISAWSASARRARSFGVAAGIRL